MKTQITKKEESIIPTKILNKAGLAIYADHIANNLLDTRSGLEAYILIKQAEELINNLKEKLIEKALASTNGKEGIIDGVKWQTKRSVAYEYDSPTIERLTAEKKSIEEKIKAHKKALENGVSVLDETTGQLESAKKTKDGLTLSITLPKE